jgi:hypothetical protein
VETLFNGSHRLVAVTKNLQVLLGGPEMLDLLTCLENFWVRMLLTLV